MSEKQHDESPNNLLALLEAANIESTEGIAGRPLSIAEPFELRLGDVLDLAYSRVRYGFQAFPPP